MIDQVTIATPQPLFIQQLLLSSQQLTGGGMVNVSLRTLKCDH